MVCTGAARDETLQQILFVAGPVNPKEPLDVEEALLGKRGGLLCALSAADGKEVAEYDLDSIPVYDGMAAADGRLYHLCRHLRVAVRLVLVERSSIRISTRPK